MTLVSVFFDLPRETQKNKSQPKNPKAHPHLDELLLGLLHHLGRELRDRQIRHNVVLAVGAGHGEGVVEALVDAVGGAVRVHGHRGPLALWSIIGSHA